MKDKWNIKNIFGWGAVLLLLALIAATNYITVFTTDDLWYGTNLVTGEPLSGVKDIVESQIWHYNNWGGRAVAHTLLQFTLLGGRVFADICNVFMTAVLMALICGYAGRISWRICLFILGSIVVFNPNWWENMMWQSGCANYLYTMNFVLLFMIIYLNAMKKEYRKQFNIPLLFLMIPIGFFAGCSNENMGSVAFVTGGCVLLYFIIKKNKISLWMWAGEVFCLAGCAFMLLSPGNGVRNGEIINHGSNPQFGFALDLFFNKYVSIGHPLFYTMFPIVLSVLFVLILLKAVKMELEIKDRFMLLAAILSYCAMWVSPHYPGRATFGTIILLISFIARIGTRILSVSGGLKKCVTGMIVFMDVTMVYELVLYIFQMKKFIR